MMGLLGMGLGAEDIVGGTPGVLVGTLGAGTEGMGATGGGGGFPELKV
jgi:hypothetical protein